MLAEAQRIDLDLCEGSRRDACDIGRNSGSSGMTVIITLSAQRQSWRQLRLWLNRCTRIKIACVGMVLICLSLIAPAQAADDAARPQAVEAGPDRASVVRVLPEAPEFFSISPTRKSAGAWRIEGPGGLVGLVASTAEVSGSVGYSGQPIDILVGITPDGRISGAVLMKHSEPVLTLGISDEDIERYVNGFAGYDLKSVQVEAFADSSQLPPIIARATVSTGVIRDAILRTARAVALEEGILSSGGAGIDRTTYAQKTWQALLSDGSIAHVRLELDEARRGFGDIAIPLPEAGDPFIELWAAILDPPTIGQNLLGAQAYSRQMASLPGNAVALFVGGAGFHSYRGTNYVQSGIFDRIAVVQSGTEYRLRRENYVRIDKLAIADSPSMKEMSLFRLDAGQGFDATQPFEIVVRADRERSGGATASITQPLTYRLPETYVLASSGSAPQSVTPLWISAWERKPVTIAIVGLMLVVVTVIFFAQEAFVRRPKLWLYTRTGFLLFTLFFLGWYANGQLSVVQVIAFFHSLLNGFRWETFLIEPIIFILWSFVALGLLFLGRGVYCGWLCPFGALQELLNEGAKRLGIRQIEVPFAVQERLWAIKYTLFLLILGVSFYSMERALVMAEIEPFKTAISMRFMREWPFVLFAMALLTAGLFIERFFCRYLCPLGAALGIPAKMKLFDWLHRRPQCGRECRFCETQCTVGAIDPLGRINPNECVLCLRCQVIMCDASQCVALKRRAGRGVEGGHHSPPPRPTMEEKSA
jgi:NosR/NirI family transcriptional regulator, nitrite reductase regulator